MAAIRNIGPIRLISKYFQRAAISNLCAKFHLDILKTKKLVCIARTHEFTDTDTRTEGYTDRQADSANSTTFFILTQNICTYFMRTLDNKYNLCKSKNPVKQSPEIIWKALKVPVKRPAIPL